MALWSKQLIWHWLFADILPKWHLKFSLESILIPNSFLLFCIYSVPRGMFKSTFSFDNLTLFFIDFHMIFIESLKQ